MTSASFRHAIHRALFTAGDAYPPIRVLGGGWRY
jgi:hypothetical protein